MVEVSETLENILMWTGLALAIVGGIVTFIGVGGILNQVMNNALIGIFSWALELLLDMMINGAMATVGGVLALAGGAIILVLKILKMTGGGV